MRQLSFNLGIGTTPQTTQNQDVDVELYRIYNALQTLAYYLDVYTGAAPVAQSERDLAVAFQTSRLSQVNGGFREAAATLIAGDLLHFNSSGKLVKAQANLSHNLKVQAVALEDCAIGQYCQFAFSGVIPLYSGLTAGNYYYLSTTAGVLGAAAPGGGNTTQLIGFAVSSAELYFQPSLTHT